TFPPTNLSDFLNGKQHASFIVRPHHRNEGGLGPNRGLQFGKIDIAISIYAKKRHAAAAFFEVLAGTQNSAVFDDGCHDMFPVGLKLSSLRSRYGGVGQRGTNDRIVGFCSAAGKNYFRRRTTD